MSKKQSEFGHLFVTPEEDSKAAVTFTILILNSKYVRCFVKCSWFCVKGRVIIGGQYVTAQLSYEPQREKFREVTASFYGKFTAPCEPAY